MVTEPGMDDFLADTSNNIENMVKKISIWINIHNTKDIFIVGHHDCAGNPVDGKIHKMNIEESFNQIKSIFKGLSVIELWIKEDFNVKNAS